MLSMKRPAFAFAALTLVLLGSAGSAEVVVREWSPEELAQWSGGHARKAGVVEGALILETQPGDPLWMGPVWEGFAATPWQSLEITLQSNVSGPAEIYWTGTTKTQHGGFSGEKRTGFEVVGDGAFHTYRLEPFWQAEKKIIRLRLDLPPESAGRYAIQSLRVVERAPGDLVTLPVKPILDPQGRWSARVSLPAEDHLFVHLRLAASAGQTGVLSFASSGDNGVKRVAFPLRADGRMHGYNLDMGAEKGWAGEILSLQLDLASCLGAPLQVESIAAGADVQGAPDLEVRWLGLADPWARAGRPVTLEATVVNHGAETAQNVQAQLLIRGARLLKTEPAPQGIEFQTPQTLKWTVQADSPGTAEASVTLAGATFTAALEFREPVSLPKAAYVPEPRPAGSDYLVGAYLFPGWNTASAWARIKPYPERQPLLGWYREELPEVADWQIKWAVEHGINFFLYDWYWDRGHRHHEHGLHSALFQAKYQNLIKFCLLYANHNGPGSHSAEDFEAMTRFWLENYFKRPNYLKIDGKPVVVMFAPMNPPRDMGGNAAVKASFESMRAKCREAGVGGLYLVACLPPDTSRMEAVKEMGYDAVSAYNWPSLNMSPEEKTARRAPFASCAEGYVKAWSDFAAAGAPKLIPPVSGGWDARPWHGEGTLVRTGRTPEAFRKHLEDCKRFLDTQEQDPKLRMLFVEAWNEWGEGSYIEPHREHGFGYLEAIRQVFAPGSPKPDEFVPADYGLGPYDIGEMPEATCWDFSKAANPLGWSGNVANSRVEAGAWQFTTAGRDPIVSSPMLRVRAAKHPVLKLRLRASQDLEGQVFWKRYGGPAMSEPASMRFRVPGDGAMHEVKLRLADNSRWRGFITELRLDPGSADGIRVAIESLRLEEEAK